MVQLLNTQNQEGPSTSGSNMLTSLRKDTGLANSTHFYGSQKTAEEEGYALTASVAPMVVAPPNNPDAPELVQLSRAIKDLCRHDATREGVAISADHATPKERTMSAHCSIESSSPP